MAISTKIITFLVCYAVALNTGQIQEKHKYLRKFPDDFKFGVSSAAYQIEGAWSNDGKGWHIWDFHIHNHPDMIADRTNGDIASNSYYLYPKDVEMLKELGVDTYRFSISWARILPSGRTDYINPLGIAYYNKLIDLLLENGITPFVTMYHWDLPLELSYEGGWLNREIVDWFSDYARVLYENFGDRVKYWLTINEPFIHCSKAYGTGEHAPMVLSPGVGYYECSKNVLLAHASAYHVYQKHFKRSQKGQISIVTSMEWPVASTDSVEDAEAVKDYFAFYVNYYADPIFSKEGNFPKRAIDKVAAVSFKQGLYTSRLKPFTAEEADFIRGTADFLALNHYSSEVIYRNKSLVGTFKVPSFKDDCFIGIYMDPSWPKGASPWIADYGPGFHKLLVYLKETYNNPIIYITENGNSVTGTSNLNDDIKVNYYRNYLTAVLDALNDGVDVRGYSIWSLMDCFEWANGYKMRFGLYEVDIEDPERQRTPRKSAYVYKDIISKRFIDYHYNPDPYLLNKKRVINNKSK